MNIPLTHNAKDVLRINDSVTLSPAFCFYAVMAIMFVYRVFVLTLPHLNLYYDEIYYYHWSLNPDFGYYSKPPMIGWLIGLTTYIGGHSSIAIKIGAVVCWTASSWVVFQIGRLLWNDRAGAAAGMLFISMPLVSLYSVFVTTDSVLLLFWSLCLWQILVAIKSHNQATGWWRWLIAGMLAGAGMLSKYTFVLLPASLLLFLLTENKYRFWFARLGPWLAAVIALLIFGLNIYWNYQNHWVAWRHTAEISQASSQWFHLEKLFEFLVSQLLLIGFVASWVLMRQWRYVWIELKNNAQARYLGWAGFCLLLLISTQALMSRAFANWAAPALISVVLFAGFVIKDRPRLWLLALIINGALLSTFYHYPQILSALGVESTKKNNPYVRLQQWPSLAKQLNPILQRYPEAKLASDSRKYLAYFGYYSLPGSDNFAFWNSNPDDIRNYYDLRGNFVRLNTSSERKSGAKEYVFITGSDSGEKLNKTFTNILLVETIPDYHKAFPGKDLYIYWVRGFRGYGDVVESQ